jgi:hypothetical protein
MIGFALGGGFTAKWPLTMARNASGVRTPGTSSDAAQGGIALRERNGALRRRQLADTRILERQVLHTPPEMEARAHFFQMGDGRIDEGRGQRRMRDAWAAGVPAFRQRFAQHRARELGRSGFRRGIECCEKHGPDQPLPQNATAGKDRRHRARRIAPQQGHERGVVRGICSRHTPLSRQKPPRNRAVVRPDGPLFARVQIGEREFGTVGATQRILRAGSFQICIHRLVARQHEMIAVVDGLSQRGFEIGAAAPARLRRGLDEFDADAVPGQRCGRREAGQTRADDMDGARLICRGQFLDHPASL